MKMEKEQISKETPSEIGKSQKNKKEAEVGNEQRRDIRNPMSALHIMQIGCISCHYVL